MAAIVEQDIAALAERLGMLEAALDAVWILGATALVLLMQIGFLFLEAGAVRAKSSVNVAQKNLADMVLSILAFYGIGFTVMFGASLGGWAGWTLPILDEGTFVFFVFQAAFVSTCATIVSGAIAERMTFIGYLALTLVIATLVYPVFGHWAWGGAIGDGAAGWLSALGFLDFAGATVVHAVGGWMALAAVIVLGPRIGRFDADGRPQRLQGHSAIFVTGGSLMLLVGWLGFNGGSTLSASGEIGRITLNTIVGAIGGAATSFLLARRRDGIFRPARMCNGLLAGLVAITAGANLLDATGALLLGLAAGLVVVVAEDTLVERFKLDDVLGAISVHGVCGAFGTIAFVFLVPVEALPAGDRLAQAAVQLLGTGTAFAWSFGIGYGACRALDAVLGLRVSEADEVMGLNAAEHGETLGTGTLKSALYDITKGDRDLTRRLDDSTGDEAADLAAVINPFLDDIQALMRSVNTRARDVSDAAQTLRAASRSSLVIAEAVEAEGVQLRRTTRGFANGADETDAALARMERDSHAIASDSEAIASEIAKLNAAAGELARSIQDVSSEATASGDVARGADAAANEACRMMTTLDAASAQIDEIVAVIDHLAGQTNLLALNATIEAARAGEAGRGFAVVAGEVKSLSDDTRAATTTIADTISELRGVSAAAGSTVAKVRDLVHQVGAALGTITRAAGDQSTVTAAFSERTATASSEASAISDSVQAFAARTREILDATTQMMRQAESGADSLGGKARDGLAQAARIDGEAGRLSALADEMRDVSSRYRVG